MQTPCKRSRSYNSSLWGKGFKSGERIFIICYKSPEKGGEGGGKMKRDLERKIVSTGGGLMEHETG